MKSPRKHTFWEKISYWFDSVMAKGTIAMILLLFAATVIVVTVIGGIASAVLGGSMGNNMWVSLMHALDAGTLAGDDTGNILFVVLMSVITLFGLFITSILIGIITTGFENRLNELKKGRSNVIDEGHTVIFGFNDALYILLESLIEANANHKNQCVVVVGDEDIEKMNAEIKEMVKDTRTTHIIVKSGPLSEEYMFRRAGVENARSVIVNLNDDQATVKLLLALNHYLETNPPLIADEHIVAVLNEKRYADAAGIAGGKRTDVIHASDAVSRIIAHTCFESGLSNVMTEVFDYEGDELYFEKVPECAGKKFSEILNLFPHEVVFGIRDKNGPRLNPPMDTVVEEGDRIILLEEDDGAFNVSEEEIDVREACIEKKPVSRFESGASLMVIGTNGELPAILMEYDKFVPKDTAVTVINKKEDEKGAAGDIPLENIRLNEICMASPKAEDLNQYLGNDKRKVLLLTDYEMDSDSADSETLLSLVDLSVIEKDRGEPLFITSEIRKSSNQRIAALIGVEDFIIGSNIVGMIAVQVSENRELLPVFHEILTEEGSEIYMKPASLYVKTGTDVNFYTVTEAASRRGEIAMGYRKSIGDTGEQKVVTNPPKGERLRFSSDDMIIVIAED